MFGCCVFVPSSCYHAVLSLAGTMTWLVSRSTNRGTGNGKSQARWSGSTSQWVGLASSRWSTACVARLVINPSEIMLGEGEGKGLGLVLWGGNYFYNVFKTWTSFIVLNKFLSWYFLLLFSLMILCISLICAHARALKV